MKETLKYTPVPWQIDWGIPLLIAVVLMLVFWAIANETPWYQRFIRGLLAGYYIFTGLWNTSSTLTEGRSYWALLLLPLYAGLAYLFTIYGHKQDVLRARRSLSVRGELPEEPETLWSPEPIVGYRYTIHSFADERFRFQEAECRGPRGFHKSPSWNCRCGYYAIKDREAIGNFTVIVLLWGSVIEHEHGYRASHMMPIGYTATPPQFGPSGSPYHRFLGKDGIEIVRPNPFFGFEHLPVVRGEEVALLIKKAIEEFDPENPAAYYGGPNGYRPAD